MKRLLALLLAICMVAALVSGCADRQTGSSKKSRKDREKKETFLEDDRDEDRPDPAVTAPVPGATGTFKIGGTAPLTGGAAIYGTAVRDGAMLAVEECNARGGIQLELRYEDDAHEAGKAVDAYHVLRDWGMRICLGSVTSSAALATAWEAAREHVFYLTPSAADPDIVNNYEGAFQMCLSDPNQGTASAQYIASHFPDARVAIIYQSDDNYSRGIRDTFVEEAQRRGLAVVSDRGFTENYYNFASMLVEPFTVDADVIFLPLFYDKVAEILTVADGYDFQFFGVDGMDGILTADGFDPARAEGVMFLSPFTPDASDSKTRDFVRAYEARYGDTPTLFAAYGYDSVMAIYQALEESGAYEEMSDEGLWGHLCAQFASMSFDGLTGQRTTWTQGGTVSKTPKAVVIRGGRYVSAN